MRDSRSMRSTSSTALKNTRDFLRFTAEQLPTAPGCKVLDLGCGTGLELDEYFALNPHAETTGIDQAPGMLGALWAKHPEKS